MPLTRHISARLALPALGLVCALLLNACGGEREFEPEEFVEAANEHGAGMELGAELGSAEAGGAVLAVELASSATQVHGGGSIVVADDVEDAEAEFARCESAASLTCYRAANVVLRLEEVSPEQAVQLEEAFTALESE